MTVGATLMLVWCAGSWDLKWIHQGDVSFFPCPNTRSMPASSIIHMVLTRFIQILTSQIPMHILMLDMDKGLDLF